MIKNYLISTLRNIKRNFLFSAINILGLTVGLTFCFLIALFVANEYSYEAFNPDKFSIYRLNLKQFRTGNDSRIVGLTGWETGERVRTAIPDIDEMIRIRPFGNYLMKTEEKSIEVSQAVLAQDNFFTFFQIPLIKGEPNQVLMDATSVVLTEETAKALFGEEDPIGKIVTLKSSFELPLKVTGVARRMKNSHINYDAVIAWNASTNHGLINDWYKYSLYTYFRVNAQSVISQVAEKINVILNSGNDEDKQEAYLQSLDRIYLSSSQIEFAGSFNSGNPRNIRILIIAAGFILLIACVNYVNTNTSKATKRSREVGVRKTMGASSGQLAVQFLGESFLISLIALALAFLATDLSLSFFNTLTGKSIELQLNNPKLWAGVFIIYLVVSFGSGIYPAILLSRFNPSQTLKAGGSSQLVGKSARKILITFQFGITIILLSGTYIIYNQTLFSINKDLGFDKSEVMVISIDISQIITNNPKPFQDAVAKIPGVELTSVGMDALGPGSTNNSGNLTPEGSINPVLTTIFNADMNFLRTYGIEVLEGRDFNPELASDSSAIIVNEEFVRQAGWNDPLGKKVVWGRGAGQPVIGVTKDFNFQDLRNKVNPVLITINKWGFWNLAVRISTDNVSETMNRINQAWLNFENELPLEYYFVDERFARYYQSDERLLNIIGLFSLLSVFVTCLGLYGLTSFVVEQRLKEIGIRKVLGASSVSVTWLINKQFSSMLLIGLALGVPITIWLGNLWLNDFAYKIRIEWWIFLGSGALTFGIALLTVSTKALKAAFMNPVDTLRYE